MSDIVPGNIANDDSPRRTGGNKAAPLHMNDVLRHFIEQRLVKGDFCIQLHEEQPPVQLTPAGTMSMFRRPPIESAWTSLNESLKSTSIYKPLCRFLNLLTDRQLLFIPWDYNTAGDEGELLRQDIIVVNAQPEEVDHFLNGKLGLDALPNRFRLASKNESRIYYSDIQMVGEVKVSNAPEDSSVSFDHATQILKYLFTVSRYQPQHAFHIGFLAYRDGFYIIRYFPDKAFFSQLYKWEDKQAAWDALRAAVAGVKDRPFTTNQFTSIESTNRQSRARLQFNRSGDFTSSDAQVYQLFDLHRGDGWHRNAYVGIGFRSEKDWKIIKHYWHDTGRRFNELEVFEKIHELSKQKRCMAGIVKVDLDESGLLDIDETPTPTRGIERQGVLIVMKTLGMALASCTSVMKIFKVMYDLVEVHRMLVEDHEILHRDISWTNVLIDVTHSDNSKHDDFCGRPFIDAVLGIEEKERKVHATLSDFDCAQILNSLKQRDSDQTIGEITGTPMFTARALSLAPARVNLLPKDFEEACTGVFPNGSTGVTQRQGEVSAFISAVKQFGNKRRKLEYVKHAPMHDAESIFWLIVLFFLRACPKDYDPKDDPNERHRRESRTKTFKGLASSDVNADADTRSIPRVDALPPQLHCFLEMISLLERYFLQAWDILTIIEGHRFHAHNALQSVLSNEIHKLQARNDEIEINSAPLGVDNVYALVPNSSSYLSSKRVALGGDEDNARESKKRKMADNVAQRKAPTSVAGRADNQAMSSTISLPEFIANAIDRDHQSKSWFMGDEGYVDYPFTQAGPELTKKVLGNRRQ